MILTQEEITAIAAGIGGLVAVIGAAYRWWQVTAGGRKKRSEAQDAIIKMQWCLHDVRRDFSNEIQSARESRESIMQSVESMERALELNIASSTQSMQRIEIDVKQLDKKLDRQNQNMMTHLEKHSGAAD